MDSVGNVNISNILKTLQEVADLNIFILLISLIIFDFITGTFKGMVLKEMNSKIGIGGLLKHISIVMMVGLFLIVGKLAEFEIVSYAFTIFYIFEYVVSIMENTHHLGVQYPDFIRKRLIQMRDKFNNWGE